MGCERAICADYKPHDKIPDSATREQANCHLDVTLDHHDLLIIRSVPGVNFGAHCGLPKRVDG